MTTTETPVPDWRDTRLPPPPSGGWKLSDLSPSERSLLHPPAWMRPCPDDHGSAR